MPIQKLVPTKIFNAPALLNMLSIIGLGTTYRNCFFICKPWKNDNQIFLIHILHNIKWMIKDRIITVTTKSDEKQNASLSKYIY